MANSDKKEYDISSKMASILGGVSNLNTGADTRPQLEYIDIDLIDPDPRNRKVDGIPALAQNIALVGLQQPLAVRATPDAEGRYMAISGHRRREALKRLVDEGEEKFRMVPCLVAPPGMSDAMVRLMILSGNMVTQSLTPAQMADATKEMEDAIYQLKEEGHEFPGKVRDYVADACGIAGSRVTRLKVIRENLIEDLKKDWERGALSESVAYAFAKQTPEVQRLTVLAITNYESTNTERKWWQEWRVKAQVETISKELKPKKGPKGSCDGCDATQQRLKRIIGHSLYDDHCSDGKCCHCCPNIGTCQFVCSHLSNEVAKAKVAAQAKKAKEKEQKQKKDAKQVAPTVRLWKRFGEARARSGLTWDQYKRKAGFDYFTRENKVADFEQGQKITPTSGGLPYTSGNGLESWRISPLIKAADALGCSVDYLLCRTDNPGGMATVATLEDAGPQWQTGRPVRSGRYYCLVECEDHRLTMTLRWLNGILDWTLAGGGGLTYGCEVVGWWPLPEDDPEEPGEDNMDDLHYGAEDDDDYLPEAGEVLGADE